MREGWRKARLGELCKIQSGNSNTKDAVPDGQFIFFDRSRKPKRSNRYLFDCEALIIAGEGAEFRPQKVDGKFDLHQRAYAIHGFGEHLLGDYLFFYLEHSHRYFQDVAVGATVKSLRQRHFENLPIIVPPLNEQKRIVAVLDQAFAALDRTCAFVEHNLADAQKLRVRAAKQLAEATIQSAPKKPLGELAEFRNGLNFSRHSQGDAVRVVGVGDFQDNYLLPFKQLKTIKIDGRLRGNDKLIEGDIISVRSNGNKSLIGRVMLVAETEPNVSFSGFVIRIRRTSDDISSRFLCRFMKSADAVAHLISGGDGAQISNLNQRILSKLEVPVPSFEVQENFVTQMARLDSKHQEIIECYESKLLDLSTLRESLLHTAFERKLA